MKVLDLYCGMGGFSLGFALALEGAEIHGVDIDRYAVETYNLNLGGFGCGAERADLLVWMPSGKSFDIVVGGPPCQPFSSLNRATSGERHPLFPTFRRYFELVREIRPRAFVFENVPGLLNSGFRELLEAQLLSLGREYRLSRGLLNAAHYGVPQTRARVIVVGIRRDGGKTFSFPRPTHSETGTPRMWLGAREALSGLADGFSVMVAGTTRRSSPNLVRSADSPSFTVAARFTGYAVIYLTWPESGHVRAMTLRESLRVQTFPDWWRFPEDASEQRRRRLVGEAVPPILAYRLAIAVGKALGLRTREPPKEGEWDLPYFRRAFADYFEKVDGDG